MKTLSTLMAVVFAAAVSLTGCNTVRGAGQDVQKAGEKVEDAAKKRQ
ncbi:entericidin A/B family lipoprotein [Xenophilus sp. Marseille-Q4582]|nr:entericidin A/B family lipoprotein [Xenophilus sp. Marseille-Q4582]